MKKIILIGKPNVGKSTLFNKILGRNVAITSDIPGTTRDVNFELSSWEGKAFEIQDPAGLAHKSKEILVNKAKNLTELSLSKADLVIFVCDVGTGVTNEDLEIAKTLRRSKKEVFLAINKADAGRAEYDIGEFFKLGFGEPYIISAKRGLGVESLLEKVTSDIEKNKFEKDEIQTINVAILGRPNVGKSSFLNKLLGDDKFLVSDIPGTTRDINSQIVKHKNKNILFLDTAGIRRRGKVGNIPGSKDDGVIEKFSVERSKESLKTADVALVILDVQEKMTAQDTHVVGEVIQENVGIILVVNKWDLATDGKLDEANIEMSRFIRIIRNKVGFLNYAPVVFVSSKTGRNIDKIMDLILEIKENRERRISTGELNRFIENINMMESGAPQRRAKIKYGTQTDINPPTFLFFVGDPEKIHFSYKRFTENQMRKKWNFGGTPIKMIFRAK